MADQMLHFALPPGPLLHPHSTSSPFPFSCQPLLAREMPATTSQVGATLSEVLQAYHSLSVGAAAGPATDARAGGPATSPPSSSDSASPAAAGNPPAPKSAMRGPKMLVAGGVAGAVARTCTAPLDRIKLLLQVQHLGQLGTKAGAYTGVVQAMGKIFREEGFRAFWKGNLLNVIRIFPYSASQFASHEHYKALMGGQSGKLTVPQRLTAGAMAGMTATALTHPLDTVRLRMAMPQSGYSSLADAFGTIIRTEGFVALYKGLFPTLLGIAPYAALNFASYDLLKSSLYKSGRVKESVSNSLLIGASAGTIATTICYPLDTVRRRMQMKGKVYNSTLDAFSTMLRTEGVRGFYRGWLANTLKVVPQNSIRFMTYEVMKKLLGITKAKTDT